MGNVIVRASHTLPMSAKSIAPSGHETHGCAWRQLSPRLDDSSIDPSA